MTTKVKRQPISCVAAASGVPARTAPRWLSAISQLSVMLHDGRLNQADTSTTLAVNPAAQPMPVTNRATAICAPVSARPCSIAPAAIGTNRVATVRRGPKRSYARPTGICASSSAMKKLALARPNASGERSRSRISSGPRIAVDVRKNWASMAVAASIASSATAAVHLGLAGAAMSAGSPERRSFTWPCSPLPRTSNSRGRFPERQ